MASPVHFISGLPRSGSTLLVAIMRQNPAVHAGMSSPVASLILALQRQMSQENEAASFIDDEQREAVLRAVFAAYYQRIDSAQTIFDTNRTWCAKLPLLARLFPSAKVIACVRDVRWIMDSIERLVRTNVLQPSGLFGFDTGGTVYSRIDAVAGAGGLVGYALNALREAFFGAEADRIMLITYETLTTEPARALDAVYDFINVPRFTHDFDDVVFEAEEFDRRLGSPGLHKVGRRVAFQSRETVLPPGLFARFEHDAFWRDPAVNVRGVRII